VQADNWNARAEGPRWMILFWGVDASKRRWHEPSARQKGIMPVYRWTGPGRDGLEVAYGKAESRPHAILMVIYIGWCFVARRVTTPA
jgi:hypothetical protein